MAPPGSDSASSCPSPFHTARLTMHPVARSHALKLARAATTAARGKQSAAVAAIGAARLIPTQTQNGAWATACVRGLSATAAAAAAPSSSSSSGHGGSRSRTDSAYASAASPGVWTLLLSGGALVGVALVAYGSESQLSCAAAVASAPAPVANGEPAKPPAGGWPLFSADDVAAHATASSRIWVSYRDGVYDITDFVSSHPGGAGKILLGAGAAIDPFWALYPMHDHQFVRDILAQYRIGTLKDYKAKEVKPVSDPYASDPKRHPALRVSNAKPFNAEPPVDILADSYITPNELFYVRNHFPVPQLDPKTFRLRVAGEGITERSYSLEDLRAAFPYRSLTAAIQCAGNRRGEMNPVKVVKGLTWGCGAISNAQFGGVRLKDVLRAQGLDMEHAEDTGAKHVHFKGLDGDATGTRYEASVPMQKVLDGSSDVLLAWEMNGVPLPPDHGAPLRVVVPGVVGARSVKWLGEVVTASAESRSHWQQSDYKGFSPSVDWHNVDFDSAPSIQELPVTSAICDPAPNAVLPASSRSVAVKGYAWSGGGRAIVRVDVSPDNGRSWHTATLQPKPAAEPQSLTRMWAWTPWTIDLPLDTQAARDGDVTLVCKAVDASYNSQPDSVAPIWNLRGCLSNAWHRVPVQIEGANDKQQKQAQKQKQQ